MLVQDCNFISPGFGLKLASGGTLVLPVSNTEIEKKLIELTRSNKSAKIFFAFLAERKRDREGFTLTRIRKDLIKAGYRIKFEDYEAAFKLMEDLRLGTLEAGTRGGSRYWSWAKINDDYLSGKAIGRIAIGKDHITDIGLTIQRKAGKVKLNDLPQKEQSISNAVVFVLCMFKNGTVKQIPLDPNRFTADEITEIALKLNRK